VAAVPTSAKDWVRAVRLRKKLQFARTNHETGIPELRNRINALAQRQIDSTVSTLAQHIEGLRGRVLDAIERSESALGADIEGILAALDGSKQKIQEVQERHAQVVDDLRLSVLDRFRQVREVIGDKIENAALKMRDLGRTQVQQHLTDLHWASLRATVAHQGLWTTGAGRAVNLRDAMGGEITRLVPQAWSRIVHDRLRSHVEEARRHALGSLREFSAEMQMLVQPDITDAVSLETVSRLFTASLERAAVRIERGAQEVTDALGQASRDMQSRVDEAVELSLGGVCAECYTDAGLGWRSRSVGRIIEGTGAVADAAKERCLTIADEAFERLEDAVTTFCTTAATEMKEMRENLPKVLHDAIERSRLTTPQTQKDALARARAGAPPALPV
jgi:hypothetical protein